MHYILMEKCGRFTIFVMFLEAGFVYLSYVLQQKAKNQTWEVWVRWVFYKTLRQRFNRLSLRWFIAPRDLLFVTRRHNMASISIFCDIVSIDRIDCIPSYLSGLRHCLCEPQILSHISQKSHYCLLFFVHKCIHYMLLHLLLSNCFVFIKL